MKKLSEMSIVAAVILLAGLSGTVEACYCGAALGLLPPGVLRPGPAVLHRNESLPAGRLSREAIHLLPHLLRAGLRAEDRHGRPL